jgi:hypothetical protein
MLGFIFIFIIIDLDNTIISHLINIISIKKLKHMSSMEDATLFERHIWHLLVVENIFLLSHLIFCCVYFLLYGTCQLMLDNLSSVNLYFSPSSHSHILKNEI